MRQKEKKKAAKQLNRYVEGVIKRSPDSGDEDYGDRERDFESYEAIQDNEMENLIDDLGYSDPDGLDEIISNLKIDR